MSKKEQGPKEHAVDELLARTFKDDLPPDMENRMQDRLLQFQDDLAGEKPAVWNSGWLPRAVLAASALLMVVAGGLLQAKGRNTALSENISLIGTSLHVADLIESSSSMLCSVKLQRENGETRQYLIRRLASGQTRIDLRWGGQQASETIWIKESVITVADWEQKSLRKLERWEQISDPFIQPLLSLLSPENLSAVLYGEWQLRSRRQEENCEWKTYVITPSRQEVSLEAAQQASMELTVDFCTYLPVEAQKTLAFPLESIQGEKAEIRIDFQWNAPIQPEVMDPRIEKMKKNV
jgi:hypothetical protein